MDKPKISVSFSGGRTSAYMSYLIKHHWGQSHDLSFVFANTGKENEETLEFVDRCDREFGLGVVWVEAVIQVPINLKTHEFLRNVVSVYVPDEFSHAQFSNFSEVMECNGFHEESANYKYIFSTKKLGTICRIVDFKTASRKGEPYEAFVRKYGLPNSTRAYCTRELKEQPMNYFRRHILGWEPKTFDTAIGIRVDEFDRMNPNRHDLRFTYPLIQNWPSTRQQVKGWWAKMSFDLELEDWQGNCDFCFKKSFKKLMRIAKASPEKVMWWTDIETKYSGFVPETQNRPDKVAMFRGGKTTVDILEMAKRLPTQLELSLINAEEGCGGYSCEAFS